MEKIRIVVNRESNTLDVWFDDPEKEFVSEETGEEVILKKDAVSPWKILISFVGAKSTKTFTCSTGK